MVGVVRNGKVDNGSRFKVRIASARCRHVFWLFTVSSGVAPQCKCTSTTVFNECYATHRRLAKDLCAPVLGGMGGVSSCSSCVCVWQLPPMKVSGMKFKPCTGVSFYQRRRLSRNVDI